MEWTCEKCGETMRENTEECTNCGFTIFKNAESADSGNENHTQTRRSEFSAGQWRCKKCDHVHERKPFVCDECGSSWLQPVNVKTGRSVPTAQSTNASSSGLSVILEPFILTFVFIYMMVSTIFRYWKITFPLAIALLVWVFVL